MGKKVPIFFTLGNLTEKVEISTKLDKTKMISLVSLCGRGYIANLTSFLGEARKLLSLGQVLKGTIGP